MRGIGLAVAVCLIAAPALAADKTAMVMTPAERTVQGDASVYVGVGDVPGEFPYWEFGAGGHVNVPFGDAWNLQIDPQFVGVYGTENPDSGFTTNLAGYAHLYRRNDTWAYGAYFGYGHTDYFEDPLNALTVGLDVQRYGPMVTFYGQAAYSHVSAPGCGGCLDVDVAMLRGELQHYFGDDTMVAADLIWHDFSNMGLHSDLVTAALSATHRFAGTHIGIFGRGQYTHYAPFDDWRGELGITLFADPAASTLKSHLLTGPAMNVQSLPSFWPDATIVSDERLKRDIVLLDYLPSGLGLYRYRYLWSDTVYVGVMAQEVAEVMPDAVVIGSDGYLRVDYARLGFRMMTWDQWVTAQHRPGVIAQTAPAFPLNLTQ